MNYYRQWHSLKNQFMVEKFYDVKKENFLNDLTDFIYAFAVKYKMFNVSKEIVENVDRYKENYYPRVKLKVDNWKLIARSILPDNKLYIAIVKKQRTDDFSIIKFNFSDKSVWSVRAPYHTINGVWYIVNLFYRWNGNDEPQFQLLILILVKLLIEIVINKIA
nr:DUF3688 family protein [Spiroplasma citri]